MSEEKKWWHIDEQWWIKAKEEKEAFIETLANKVNEA
jgi:hypothetical protein